MGAPSRGFRSDWIVAGPYLQDPAGPPYAAEEPFHAIHSSDSFKSPMPGLADAIHPRAPLQLCEAHGNYTMLNTEAAQRHLRITARLARSVIDSISNLDGNPVINCCIMWSCNCLINPIMPY